MLVVVTTVSPLVHLYCSATWRTTPASPRFFAYLSLFTFAMLALVTADNFMQLFFGWEGVGLASYLLIGFWYKRRRPARAAIKAFVVNRVGDFGFAARHHDDLLVFGSIQFAKIFADVAEHADTSILGSATQRRARAWIGLLLFVGAMGKSAQFRCTPGCPTRWKARRRSRR